jgi:hypothetical protein
VRARLRKTVPPPGCNGTKDYHEPGRRVPHVERKEGCYTDGKIGCAIDTRRPDRIVERREQQSHNRCVNAAQR